MNNELCNELATNFIEYAASVNEDRAIPNATDGLKPVAKRILYGAYSSGYNSKKPHVKCARVVGDVMGNLHPHGESSIYGALVRLAQPWVLRYPLIDFHGNMGNRDGDGPAAHRYTESRLGTIVEDGMLRGINKNAVDFIPNFDETCQEPVELPALFPNLLCNPNAGIGVAIACNWAPHNLREVAQAIYDYMDDKEPMLPGPDFPTGGIVMNKKDIPNIMRTGHGSVKIRGKYIIEGNSIIFTEIPYGVATENLMKQIGQAADEGRLPGVKDLRNESDRKHGFRLNIECDKSASIATVVKLLFKETDLQSSFSYNQVALVDKTPTELNLKDCIKIYVNHNEKCISREAQFNKDKCSNKLEIVEGLLKALEDIDNIIALIKGSESAAVAVKNLIAKYKFTDSQARAIVDMKLGKLAGLEKIEIQNEKKDLLAQIAELDAILADPQKELRARLEALVAKYGDDRRTELAQIADDTKEEKETVYVEPEKCVVVLTESGNIKRIPLTSFKTQKAKGKGIKTQDDITSAIIRTNTIDSLMVFTNKGKMYRLIVDSVPSGTNTSKGVPVNSLVEMDPGEKVSTIYSIYKDTDAKYVFFSTKKGLVKKTPLEEYEKTKKKTGLIAINVREDDELVSVTLVKDETIILLSKNGQAIHFKSTDVNAISRTSTGVKGISLAEGDEVVAALPVRDRNDNFGIFVSNGCGKSIELKDLPLQARGGKGFTVCKLPKDIYISSGALINNTDTLLLVGTLNSICISAADVPVLGRSALGNILIKGNIKSVSKV